MFNLVREIKGDSYFKRYLVLLSCHRPVHMELPASIWIISLTFIFKWNALIECLKVNWSLLWLFCITHTFSLFIFQCFRWKLYSFVQIVVWVTLKVIITLTLIALKKIRTNTKFQLHQNLLKCSPCNRLKS